MSLLEEQRHALKQIIAIAVEQQVQAVLIAGDVFDRSIAPVEAVQLLDEIVTSLNRLWFDRQIFEGRINFSDRAGFCGAARARRKCFFNAV